MKRRIFLAGAAAMAIGTGLSKPSEAIEPSQAVALVQRVTNEILALIAASGSQQSKERTFIAIMDRSANMRQIAGFSLGQFARGMSDAQKARYIPAFKQLIAKIFVNRFNEYQGESIEVTRARDAGRRGVFVEAQARRAGDLPINFGWLVDDRAGRPLITDLTIEGVSMAQSQRSEFTAQIAGLGGNLDAFIRQLEQRVGR